MTKERNNAGKTDQEWSQYCSLDGDSADISQESDQDHLVNEDKTHEQQIEEDRWESEGGGPSLPPEQY